MTPPFPFVARPSSFDNAFVRTFKPKVLQVVHVTGNKTVAGYPDGFGPGQSPYTDWLYAAKNPDSKDGPSANNYVGRKGSTIELWDPRTHAAWSNGDLVQPRLDLPGVKYLADLRAKGVNANKGCYREIELSGYPGSFDPTDEQIEVCAWFAATDSIETGIDIVLHETVLTHAYINTVDRQNCAFRPVIREARMKQLCDRAIEIRAGLSKPEEPLRTFTFDQATTGRLSVKGPGHYYLRLKDGSLNGPIDPANPGWQNRPAFGPVTLTPDIDGKTTTGPRAVAYIVGNEAAAILASDVTFTPDSAKDAVNAALDHVASVVPAFSKAIDEARIR